MNISKEERIQVIDPTDLSWLDMALLKKQDPFMYYSIPGNRDKKNPGEEIDLSELDHAPDSMDEENSRSFTEGTFRDRSLIEEAAPRRHSGSGATLDLELQCPSFTVKEEEIMFAPSPSTREGHSRTKSLMVQPTTYAPRNHRRNQTESNVDHSKLVHRKSAISFECSLGVILDDIIDEVAELQPLQPNTQIDVERRGSELQDVLFDCIAALGQVDDVDSSDSDM